MVYDYSTQTDEEDFEELIKTLSGQERLKLVEYINQTREQAERYDVQKYVNWIMDAIVPIWREVAEKTKSVLEVQKVGDEIDILIANKNRINIDVKQKMAMYAVSLAEEISVDLIDKEIQMNLTYKI